MTCAGRSVSAAGDVNGDGFADLIVGARGSDVSTSDCPKINAGEAYVVFGKQDVFGSDSGRPGDGRRVIDLTRLTLADGFIIQGDAVDDEAGFSVSGAGDVNGDGYADLLIGAPVSDVSTSDGPKIDAGEAYLVFGKASGFGSPTVTTLADGSTTVTRQVIDLTELATEDGFIIQGDAAGDRAGWSVSGAGDVNGDGYADLIVGAPFGDDGGTGAGEAYVLFGKAANFGSPDGNGGRVIDLSSLITGDGFIIQGDEGGTYDMYTDARDSDRAGFSVSDAGDVNGDGYADLIIGAPEDGYGDDNGAAYVVFGSPDAAGRRVLDLTDLAAADGFIIQGDASR